MAFTHHDILRFHRRGIALIGPAGPTGEFLRAALVGALGVGALSSLLPGVTFAAFGLALTCYAAAVGLAAVVMHRTYPHARLGLCNHVTLIRLVLVSALLASLLAGAGLSWAFFALALIALSLDGLDGWLARRQGLSSGFGASFDMEVDSALALTLALNAAFVTDIGWFAVLLGLPRYLFGAAGLLLPWMQQQLPDRFSRKAVCVLQLAVLIALQAPVLPPSVGTVLVPMVAAVVLWSFVKDVVWLWRRGA